jgi:class 3 adenylate cyclase
VLLALRAVSTPRAEPRLPAGAGRWSAVTMLMTDIVESTALWEEDEVAMSDALRRHDHLVRQAVAATRGRLIKSHCGGDGTLAVFLSVDLALAAAVRLQRAVAMTDWPTPRPLRLRAAVHHGRAEHRDRDYFGLEVNRCARLCDTAGGNQVLVSAAAADQVQGRWTLALRGPVSLRGLAGQTAVFEVATGCLTRT